MPGHGEGVIGAVGNGALVGLDGAFEALFAYIALGGYLS